MGEMTGETLQHQPLWQSIGFKETTIFRGRTAVAQLLRCCTTNRKIAGSIPDGVIGIFHWHNPSDRTMALGSTQPLKEMSTRRISWGKCGRCVRLTTLPPPCAVVMKSGNLNFLEPPGLPQACNGTAFTIFRDVMTYSGRTMETFPWNILLFKRCWRSWEPQVSLPLQVWYTPL